MKTTQDRSEMDLQRNKTKRRIIRAAEKLFSEKGFRCTTIQAITKCAHCNAAAVSYYFRGKEELYVAVFQHKARVLRNRLTGTIEELLKEQGGAITLEMLLQEFANALLQDILCGSRQRPRDGLMAWELLEHHVPLDVYERDFANPVVTTMTDAIQRICPWMSGDRAVLCVESIIAQFHWIIMGEIRPRRLQETQTQSDVEERMKHLIAFSAAGIRQFVAS